MERPGRQPGRVQWSSEASAKRTGGFSGARRLGLSSGEEAGVQRVQSTFCGSLRVVFFFLRGGLDFFPRKLLRDLTPERDLIEERWGLTPLGAALGNRAGAR